MIRRTRTLSTPSRLSALAVAGMLLVGCASSGTPVSWGDQADENGRGLAERNFLDACIESNGALSESRATTMCECVLAEVQGSATWDDYKRLNDHFKDKGDEVTESGLADMFPWFTDAVAACNT